MPTGPIQQNAKNNLQIESVQTIASYYEAYRNSLRTYLTLESLWKTKVKQGRQLTSTLKKALQEQKAKLEKIAQQFETSYKQLSGTTFEEDDTRVAALKMTLEQYQSQVKVYEELDTDYTARKQLEILLTNLEQEQVAWKDRRATVYQPDKEYADALREKSDEDSLKLATLLGEVKTKLSDPHLQPDDVTDLLNQYEKLKKSKDLIETSIAFSDVRRHRAVRTMIATLEHHQQNILALGFSQQETANELRALYGHISSLLQLLKTPDLSKKVSEYQDDIALIEQDLVKFEQPIRARYQALYQEVIAMQPTEDDSELSQLIRQDCDWVRNEMHAIETLSVLELADFASRLSPTVDAINSNCLKYRKLKCQESNDWVSLRQANNLLETIETEFSRLFYADPNNEYYKKISDARHLPVWDDGSRDNSNNTFFQIEPKNDPPLLQMFILSVHNDKTQDKTQLQNDLQALDPRLVELARIYKEFFEPLDRYTGTLDLLSKSRFSNEQFESKLAKSEHDLFNQTAVVINQTRFFCNHLDHTLRGLKNFLNIILKAFKDLFSKLSPQKKEPFINPLKQKVEEYDSDDEKEMGSESPKQHKGRSPH